MALIPLVVGIMFIVPPMIYAEKLFLGAFTGSFAEFYPRFFTGGVYPTGNLSWHHFWFIVYLYLFCMLGLKVFSRLTANGNKVLNSLAERGQGYGIYRFIIPLVMVEVSLRAIFPGFRDLIVHMEVRTPHEIEQEIGLTEGNIFQGELTIDQLLFNRPFPGYAQYRMPLRNLYMCGSSTHPGGGVSATCGANAAREILMDLRRPNTVPEDDFYDE